MLEETPWRLPRSVAGARIETAAAGPVATAVALLVCGLLGWSPPQRAEALEAPLTAEQHGGRFAVHGQLTYIEQEANAFRAPYRSANSLTPDNGRETVDVTLFLGARLWTGAEAWFNPELNQGFGLDNTLGLAGFPSGAAYKVGRKKPYLRLPRTFLRQTLNQDAAREPAAGGPIQFEGTRSPNRLVFTVGKFSVTDVFDTSQYAHDPRIDFMNWTAVDAASFDYAADAWGYTIGAAIEWYRGPWALRGGVFDLSNVPNSAHLEPGGHEFQIIAEVERHYELAGRPGRMLLTGYDSRGRMALLADALQQAAASAGPVDLALARHYRSRMGASVTIDQQLSPDVGLFARAGSAAGNVEAYEFTDVDRGVAVGLSLKGRRWGRRRDVIGIAAIVNGISATRERYLNAGGLGVLVGDGQLPHPGAEQILETYYELGVGSESHVTFDYQNFNHPAFNRDRGPVSIFSLRVHAQF